MCRSKRTKARVEKEEETIDEAIALWVNGSEACLLK